MSTAERAVRFDPLEPGFVESPYEQYARLRAVDPVHWSELLDGWVLTRFDDANAVLRDATVSSDLTNAAETSRIAVERKRLGQDRRAPGTLVLRDDPDHSRLRRLMQAPFGPRAIGALRGMVEARVDAAFEEVAARARGGEVIDVVDDFAYPLPVTVFCEMLGIPDEDSPKFRRWTHAVARNLDPVMSDEERAECMRLHEEMERYLEELIDEKKRHPGDDIMTALVNAEDSGDRLSRDELVAQVVTLYVAGHEPTTALIGNGLLALLRHPDELSRLQTDPALLPHAINELLRYDGPNQFVRRIAMREMRMAERVVEPGSLIFVGVGAANRDPDRWGDDVDRVRIDRPDASQHLQFGAGVHNCLGAHLARLQAEVAMHALLTRLIDLELADEPVWSERMVLRSVQQLRIRCRVDPSAWA